MSMGSNFEADFEVTVWPEYEWFAGECVVVSVDMAPLEVDRSEFPVG